MRQLLPEEVAIAETLKGFRVGEFVGGRIALRAACGQLGTRASVLGRNDRGAPTLPEGYVGSVSHKGTLAIGMVARAAGGTLGVDLEEYLPERPAVASKVLTESEQAAVAALDPNVRWMGILLRFSIKESIYKALDPYVHRYVGFQEAEVHPDLQGTAEVELRLKNGEGPLQVDARYQWIRGRLLTSARILPTVSNEACVTQ
jgi:enterobactin synthetase component D